MTDPTLDSDIVQFKDQVLAQDSVREYLKKLSSRSLGLVLAGGGAKGAYEGGVLLALYDCGLRHYEAIAGTSVGALNAALAHQLSRTNDRTIVARLWADLSPNRVLKWSWFATPLGLLMRIGIFLAAVPAFLTSRLMTLLESNRSERSNVWLGALYRAKELAVIVPFTLVLAVVSLVLVVSGEWPLRFDRALGIATGVILASGIFLKSRDIVGHYLSLASNTPLQQTIRGTIDIAVLRRTKPPIYCTMARETTWWDPFEISEWSHVSDGARRHGRTPLYLNLGEATSDGEAIEWLLQTAALPEFFSKRPVRGHYAVDGGLVDNVPIYPVAIHNPDRIIVVYLDYKRLRNKWLYSDEAARTRGMAEFKALSELDTRGKANEIRRQQIARDGPIREQGPNLVPMEPRLFTIQQFREPSVGMRKQDGRSKNGRGRNCFFGAGL